MSTRIYTPEDERLYKLRLLPEIPFIGVEESRRRRAAWEAYRVAYRKAYPIVEAIEPGDLK